MRSMGQIIFPPIMGCPVSFLRVYSACESLISDDSNSQFKFFWYVFLNSNWTIHFSSRFFDNLILYTKPVTHDQIIKKTRRVVNCPVTVQKYIPKEFELRITVVGNQAFACAIYSQETERTTHDWRKYDLTHTPHKVFNLPDDINQKCLTLVDKLGLKFGCIDMIVTPEGQFVFLEINPNGQWLWIERLTNLPIGDAITDLLCLDNQR